MAVVNVLHYPVGDHLRRLTVHKTSTQKLQNIPSEFQVQVFPSSARRVYRSAAGETVSLRNCVQMVVLIGIQSTSQAITGHLHS